MAEFPLFVISANIVAASKGGGKPVVMIRSGLLLPAERTQAQVAQGRRSLGVLRSHLLFGAQESRLRGA